MTKNGIEPKEIPLCPYCEVSERDQTDDDLMPLTQREYNEITCDDPKCKCAFVHFNCDEHPDSGLEIEYCKEHGVLSTMCHECGKLINSTFVANEVRFTVSKHGPGLLAPETFWKPK